LIGKRAEFRLAEVIAMALAPALDLVTLGALRKYHSVRAETVGRAMVAAAKQLVSGASVDEYDGIVSLGKAA
jgi:hypothetical protein